LPGETEGLVPSPDWKKSRIFSAKEKLRQLQFEFNNIQKEIDIARRLIINGQAVGEEERKKHLSDLEARAVELKEAIDAQEDRLGLFDSERAWVPGDTRNMSIGQGNVLASPLQMARLSAAIANGGRLLIPHLVIEPETDYVEQRLPLSPDNLAVLRKAMHEVVFGRQGTARQQELRRHNVAAKTGTAEIGGKWNNGWIIGFAPYDRPRIAFAVVVEHTEFHGGEIAGPILARILDAYFEQTGGD
jgi:cell division protein FtsI/penicillin-binding protein 2